MIDLAVDRVHLEKAIARARDQHVLIPTFSQIAEPDSIPGKVVRRLERLGLWDIDPLNLFRIGFSPSDRRASTASTSPASPAWKTCCRPSSSPRPWNSPATMS